MCRRLHINKSTSHTQIHKNGEKGKKVILIILPVKNKIFALHKLTGNIWHTLHTIVCANKAISTASSYIDKINSDTKVKAFMCLFD